MVNWENSKSTPLKDIQAATKLLQENIGLEPSPWVVCCSECGYPVAVGLFQPAHCLCNRKGKTNDQSN